MKRGIILGTVFLIMLIPLVQGQLNYCYIDIDCTNVSNMPNPLLTYVTLGYVSLQGHYSDVASTPGFTNTYNLCCPDAYTLDTGGAAWSYSRINPPLENGSGHVGLVGGGLPNTTRIGTNACSVRSSCNADETCMFNVSEENQSHIMDCYESDNPSSNLFPLSMCCKLTELCYDGIDNDADGFIDCADGDCNGIHQFPNPATDPQLCTNAVIPFQSSPFNTSACIIGWNAVTNKTIFNISCLGQWPPPPPTDPYFYCGFGPTDDPSVEPTGVCCPVGWYSRWNPGLSKWECRESAQCGLGGILRCDFDSFFDETNWYNAVYSGDPNDWCNTQVTDLLYPIFELPGYDGSTGCCLIEKHGEINYWLDEDNVKIWG